MHHQNSRPTLQSKGQGQANSGQNAPSPAQGSANTTSASPQDSESKENGSVALNSLASEGESQDGMPDDAYDEIFAMNEEMLDEIDQLRSEVEYKVDSISLQKV